MKKVLVVDDQIARPIARLLRSFGLHVTAATSFEDGASAIQREPFDILLVDLSLSRGKSGLDLIKLARANSVTTRVILMSGRDGPPSFVAPGTFDAFLAKPFSRDDVAVLVGSAPSTLESSAL